MGEGFRQRRCNGQGLLKKEKKNQRNSRVDQENGRGQRGLIKAAAA